MNDKLVKEYKDKFSGCYDEVTECVTIDNSTLWLWIEQKIKDAKEEGFQAGCDFTCKQYGDGKTENQIKIEELNEVYGYIDFMDDTLIKYLDKRINELKEKL